MEIFKRNTDQMPSDIFLLPDNYFEEFNDRTMIKISKSDNSFLHFSNFQTHFYKIAAVIILSLTVPIMNNYSNSPIEATEIGRYLALSNIDDMEIAALLEAEDLENFKTGLTIDKNTIEDILLSTNNFETYITN